MKSLNISKQWQTMQRIWSYIRRYKLLMIGTLLCASCSVILTLYTPILVGRAIDGLLGQGLVDLGRIVRILVQVAIVVLLTAIAQWGMGIINNYITVQVVKDVRNDAFLKLQALPLSYLDSHLHGDTLSRIITDVDQFADGLLMGFTQLITGVLSIFCTIIFMWMLNFNITVLVVCLTPISLLAANFIAKRTYAMFQKQSEVRAEQTALIDEMIGGQKIVQVFSYEAESMARFDDTNDRLEQASVRAIFFSSTTNPVTRFINGLVYAGVALMGSFLAINGGITIGGITAFLSYANQYTKPFNEISGVLAEMQNAIACAQRVFSLLDEEEQIPDAEDAIAQASPSGAVVFSHVSFSYTPEQPLIRDFHLSVAPGQRVAVVGPTGCGKTTLINLIMRFYDVNDGAIYMDQVNIKELTRHSLRRNIGMVLQDTWLRHGTVRENITMGKPEATEEEMIAAAKAAHAHHFIMQLAEGYDTVIHGDGGDLSQGQRQMLCITRVMLCLPPILILDEATSSIDTRTEMLIQQAFARMMQNRTSFIVAHRLSTIREADLILVMRDGNVVEKGNHNTLMQKDGFYAKLYNSQYAKPV